MSLIDRLKSAYTDTPPILDGGVKTLLREAAGRIETLESAKPAESSGCSAHDTLTSRDTPGSRYWCEGLRVYGPTPGKRRWSYRIRDKDQCTPGFGARVVATFLDAELADRALTFFNGEGSTTLELSDAKKLLEKRYDHILRLANELDARRVKHDALVEEHAALLRVNTKREEDFKFVMGERDEARLEIAALRSESPSPTIKRIERLERAVWPNG